jgi:hypothetical protein
LEPIGKERLRKIVDQTNLTVTALAKMCNVTRSGFNVWLRKGMLPIEQLEKILVIAAFPGADISDDPAPFYYGDKKVVPDFLVKPKDSKASLTVEVKLDEVDQLQIDAMKRVGIGAVVFLKEDIVTTLILTSIEQSARQEEQVALNSHKDGLQGENFRFDYLLRPHLQHAVHFELPLDLTEREAERIALYIKSLVNKVTPTHEAGKEKTKRSNRGGK